MNFKPVWKRVRGHRLTDVSIDGTSFSVQHDAAGRTTKNEDFDLKYDALNKLAGVYDPLFGTPVELYAYDAQGRLAVVSQFTNDPGPLGGVVLLDSQSFEVCKRSVRGLQTVRGSYEVCNLRA